jgi:DNA-directed RNA polymerase sigma subunit (sigma70/sigma32)
MMRMSSDAQALLWKLRRCEPASEAPRYAERNQLIWEARRAGATRQEIARIAGISVERVRQIEQNQEWLRDV